MSLDFSRRLALIAGVVLPLIETARRWHQLHTLDGFFSWFDDVLIASFLLMGAYKAGKDPVTGRAYLAAAWGFACALGYDSFLWQVMSLAEPDPSGVSPAVVVVVKGVMLACGVAALIGALRWKQPAHGI